MPSGRQDWLEHRLVDISESITSGPRGWASYYAEHGDVFLRIGNLTRDHLDLRFDDVVRVQPPAGAEGVRTALVPGDLLISITADLGIIGVVPSWMGVAYINQHIARVRLNPTKANSRFLGHQLAGPLGQEQFYRLNDVGAKAGLNLPTVGRLKVWLPPLTEQTYIVEVLDSLDAAIRSIELAIDKQKMVVQGFVQQLFSNWEAEGLQSGWSIASVGDLCEKITDGTHQAVKTAGEGIPFLYVSCVRYGRILWDQASRIPPKTFDLICPGRIPVQGAVLYTAVGSYGHAAVVNTSEPFGFQRHIAILYPNRTKVLPNYLAAWFNSEAGHRVADRLAIGNAQKTVTLGALGAFPIPLPKDLETQANLMGPIEAAQEPIMVLEQELTKLRSCKSGLSSDLLTGRVRVPMGVRA